MKIALAQINTTVADFGGNAMKIREAYWRAANEGAQVVLFPELALPGYPPLDLLDRGDFLSASEQALEELVRQLSGPPAVVGTIRRNAKNTGKAVHNSAAVIRDSRVLGYHDKILLPTYDVFDEARYFEPGDLPRPFPLAGRQVGIAICEDLWNPGGKQRLYRRDPGGELKEAGAELILSPAASPFHRQKLTLREGVLESQARQLGMPVLVANLVGGNTELIFAGRSVVVTPAGVVARAASFAEDLLLVESDALPSPSLNEDSSPEIHETVASALVLGIRDFFRKCGFERAVIGLSGGIDSSVTAALACEALGPEAVRGVAMPSRYSSEGSQTDARELAERFGMPFELIDIDQVFGAFLETLSASLGGIPQGVTAENLQPRIRGTVLMAISNQR
ncbi:MAG: NAD(+) synthase, partial [Planctomycetota bacterium]